MNMSNNNLGGGSAVTPQSTGENHKWILVGNYNQTPPGHTSFPQGPSQQTLWIIKTSTVDIFFRGCTNKGGACLLREYRGT